MHIPNTECPPSSSSIAPPFGGHIHSLPRVVGETLEHEGQQITGGNEDEWTRGKEGGQEEKRTTTCTARGDS
eukprot:6815032-Pyramimonas_sp.AAC.1